MGSVVQQVLMFLVQFIFGLYGFAIVARIWLRLIDADYHHPFVASIAKTTGPVVKRLQKYIPDLGKMENASIVFLLLLILIKLLLVSFISGHVPRAAGLIAWTLSSTIEVGCDTIFYVMIIMAILSWIPNAQPGLASLFTQMTAPILAPIRRFVPLFAGMDLSPIVVLVIIQIIEMLLVQPVIRASLMAAFQ